MSEKKESIKRYTVEELRLLREKGGAGTDWEHVLNLSQNEADKAAIDNGTDFSDENFWNNVEFSDSSKKLIGIVLEPEVALFYKKLGTNCQSTINSVLKAYMLVQEHRV